jgi:DNA-binding MarR family transcriptional regulator
VSSRSPTTGARLATQLEAVKRESMGQLLLRAARLFNEHAIARVQRSGEPRFRLAHTRLFPHIDLEGTRLTELARRAGVTKQAVGPWVTELESFGVVRREPDPLDGRAQRVRFTERGLRALLHGLSVLGELEDELAREIGASRMRELRKGLALLVDALAVGPDPG